MSGNALSKLGIVSTRINKTQFEQVRSVLEPVLAQAGLGREFKLGWTMGSAGSWAKEHPYYTDNTVKTDAGDVDVMIDADELMSAFPPDPIRSPKDYLRDSKHKLSKWLASQGFTNTGTALNLHVKLPDADVQVDLIVKPNAAETIAGHQLDYSVDKGMNGSAIWIKIWPTLVKMTPNPRTGKVSLGIDPKTELPISALQLSPDRGLVDRETNEVIYTWQDKDKIAEVMVGPGATARDISSLSGLKTALIKLAPEKWQAVKDLFDGN